MIYETDWLLRQIQQFIYFIAHAILGKENATYTISDENCPSSADNLHRTIYAYLAENRICDAENLLFESIDTTDISYLYVALDFYQTINELSDDVLEDCNFSRTEIDDGLKQVLAMFHL